MTIRVLVLGGTGEARELADRLAGRPGLEVVSSLAGRTSDPRRPAGRIRVGGFGGADGLAGWLAAESIGAVVDATHPFATTITEAAVTATGRLGIPLLVLRRPGWTAGPGDDWRRVPSLAAAAASLPGERVLLTVGRGEVGAFAADQDRWFLIRSVEAPVPPLPPRAEIVTGRGPFTVADELALLREHAIEVVVTKDSGGQATAAKLTAARALGLPVVMVDRPPGPDAPTVASVAGALAWLEGYLYCSAMNAAAYTLEPVDNLDAAGTAGVRQIFEDGFAPHLRSEFGTLTTGREPGEVPLALMQGGQARGFVMLRPLGATGWTYLRYFVVDQNVRGQGLGGIMWDLLLDRLREDGYPLLVWDVEDPDEPGTDPDEVRIRQRRIAFYQRHGGRLLPVAAYGNPHGDEWTPMRLMAAPTGTGGGPASLPGTGAVLDAVYEYRWRLDPADSRVRATRVIDEQKGQ